VLLAITWPAAPGTTPSAAIARPVNATVTGVVKYFDVIVSTPSLSSGAAPSGGLGVNVNATVHKSEAETLGVSPSA
jgi:hypothetical protein